MPKARSSQGSGGRNQVDPARALGEDLPCAFTHDRLNIDVRRPRVAHASCRSGQPQMADPRVHEALHARTVMYELIDQR